MRKIVFLQCLLCSLLLMFGILTCIGSSEKTVEAGAFGSDVFFNTTLEDLSNRCFSGLFYE